MLKSKFRHVAEKNHYKMYKAGKTWLFANIVALSFGAVITTSNTKPVKADETDHTSTESPNGSSSAQQKSAVIQSSSKASSMSSSADSTNTSDTKAVTSNSSSATSETNNQSTSSSEAKTVQSKNASPTSLTSSQASQTNATSISVAKTVSAASLASSNTSSNVAGIDKAENTQSTKSANAVDSTNKAQAKSESTSSAASTDNSSQSPVPTVSSLLVTKPSSATQLAKSAAANTTWTDTTTPVTKSNSETSQAAEMTTTSAVTVKTTLTSSETGQSTVTLPTEKNMQTLSLIDPNKFALGTKIAFSLNGNLIVNLPVGASITDIRNTQLAIENMGIKNAQITAVSDAVNTDYATGETTALSDLTNGFWSGTGSTSGLPLSDWTGVATGFPDFQKIYSQFITTNGNSQVVLEEVKNLITTWVNSTVSKLSWDTLSNSRAYKTISSSDFGGGLKNTSSESENGYRDTIQNFVKGELTAESYYLWLVTSTANTSNSLFYGTQGYNDAGVSNDDSSVALPHFATLLNTLNEFTTNTTTDVNLAKAYQAGHATALSWFTGDANEDNKIASSVGPGTTDAGYNSHVLLSEIGAAASAGLGTTLDIINYQFPPRTGIPGATFISFPEAKAAFMTNSNFPSSIDGTLTAGFSNLTDLEQKLALTALNAYYNEWENIVNNAFKQATTDALAGKSLALDYSDSAATALTPSTIPKEYASNTNQTLIYRTAYRYAKSYLTGYEPRLGSDTAMRFGKGNTSIGVNLDDNSVPSPLDLAIYSVLTGKTYTYNTATNGVNTDGGEVKTAIVGKNFQSKGYSSTNADWIGTAAQQDMYQLAWSVADQAKLDFLADVQLAVNKGNNANLTDLSSVLPNDKTQGILTDQQWAYYKQNSYVYYKVFSTLYKSYLIIKDAENHLTSVIDAVVKDSDNYVQQNGDSLYGDPIAQSIEMARAFAEALAKDNGGVNPQPELTAQIDKTEKISLNGDTTYTQPYSENTDGTAATVVQAKVITPTAETTIDTSELEGADTAATKTIQNAIDYGYVHEESMAIPAYEAGFAKVQMTLNVTPKDKQSALSGPNDGDTFTFENTSTVTDDLTPVLTTTNPDGSTVWTVHYTNADGSSTVITINRAALKTGQTLGDLTSTEVVVDDITGLDGKPAAAKDSQAQSGTSATVAYPSVGLHGGVVTDGKENTTVTATVGTDGTVTYQFVRVALNTVTTGTQPAIIDTLTPSQTTPTTPLTNGAVTQWSTTYKNADGTTSVVTVDRAKPADGEKLGNITGMEVVTSGGSLTTPIDTGLIKAPIGTALVTSYPTDPADSTKLTTVGFTPNPDGTIGYRFTNANVANLAGKAKTANVVNIDGTNKGTLYQDGWDYRKSFIAYNTIIQQVADTNFKNQDVKDSNGVATNKLTTDQTYAGFFESKDKTGQIVKNSSVQLIPSSDVNNNYGTYTQRKITNLDGSYVIVTMYVNGDVGYEVYDTNGKESATNAIGKMLASQDTLTVTNKDQPAGKLNADGTVDESVTTTPSFVTITRTANDAITISETGVQSTMANTLTVQNEATTANVAVTVGNNVEPSFTSTTIVTPVSALHPGVVFSEDTSVGDKHDGITSTFDDDKSDNPNGLQYQGTVKDPTSTDMSLDYGQARNTTTTLQYVANNVSNAGTGTTATINIDTANPTVTIALGKYTDGVNAGQVISTSSFDADGVITPAVRAASKDATIKASSDNIGTAIFDWSSWYQANKAALNNENWTYDDNAKTLTYTPTNKADQAALLAAVTNGPITINWSGAKDATHAAMVDQYGDVMNLVITANVKSENSVTKDVNTSTTDVTNNQYTFTHNALEKLVNPDPSKPSDPNDLVTKFIEKWATSAGATSRTYTGKMNGMPLPKGVAAVTLKSDGDIVVTYDKDKATDSYDAKTNTNVIKLVLPFTVDAKGDMYVPDETLAKKQSTDKTSVNTGDTSSTTTDTSKTSDDDPTPPLAGLTLNMNMQASVKVAYKAAAGGANTTVNLNDRSTTVLYAATGTDIKTAYTLTNVVLGSTYTASVPATIAADKTTNYDGATYKLINGVATNTPDGVTLTDTKVQFGKNDQTYLYAKTVGVVQGVTPNKPAVITKSTDTAADGITETIDLSQEAKDYDWNTVTFAPDANTAANYDVTVTINKSNKTLTVNFKPKTSANNLDFLADAYQNGLALNGWLTDKKTVAGSATPVLNNALYVETKAVPAFTNYTKAATIDVAKSAAGYDAAAHTYTFDVPADALSAQELTLLTQGQKLVLTNTSSSSDVQKGYLSYSSDNWGSVNALTISLNADGTAHVVATLDTSSTPENSLQNGAILVAGAATDSPVDSGIHLALTLNNDLKQDSTGLPTGITKPVYVDINNKALHTNDAVTAQAVTGYNVTGATYNGTAVAESDLTLNADGTATYSAQHGWGSNTGATVADKLVWDYTPAPMAATIGVQEKFYGMADPTTAYAVTGLSTWLKAPTWVAADFTRSHVAGNTDDTKDPVGDYKVTLSEQGIADLQKANPNYTITDAKGKSTVDNVVAGKLTIKAAPIKSDASKASRQFNNLTMTADPKDSKTGKNYAPELTFTATDPTKSTATPETFQLAKDDYTYTDANGQTIDPDTTKAVGTYTWTLTAQGKTDLYTKLGNKDGLNKDLNFLLDDTSVETGSFEITADPIDVTVNAGTRDYNAKDVGTDHSSKDSKDFTNISFKNQGTDTTKVPDAVTLNAQTDFTYKNDKGQVVSFGDVKNAGTYTWTVNDAGQAEIAAKLGEVKDAAGNITQGANFTIDDSKLTGTYTVSKVDKTFALTAVTAAYDGMKHSVVIPTDMSTGIDDEKAVIKLDNPDQTLVGSHSVTGKATDALVNANYNITVTPADVTVNADALTPTYSTGTKQYDGKTVSGSYTPAITFASTDTTNHVTTPTVTLVPADYTYSFVSADGKTTTSVADPTTAKNVGTYTWKLTDAGIADVKRQVGTNFDVGDLSAKMGSYKITAKPVTVALTDKSFIYDGTAHALDEPDTTTATGVTGEKVVVKLDNNSRTAIGETNVTGEATDAPINSNYTITVTGAKLTVTGLPVTVKTNNGERKYNAKTIGANHSSTDSKDFTKITLANKGTDKTTLPDLDSLDAATDFDYTDSTGTTVQPSDVKNAGTYNWKVNAAGLVKLYKALGSKTGVATDANFTIDPKLLNGTYTIDKVDKTVSLDAIKAQYNNEAETITPTTAELATGIGDEHVDVTLTNSTRTAVGHNDVTGAATANVATNDNYNITVTPSTIDITAAPLSVTTNPATRVYDGNDFNANHKNGDGTYTPTITFALSGKDNKAPLPAAVSLDYTDLNFSKDVKDVGDYTWTVKPSGLTKIYKALGSKTGVASDANYSVTASELTGTYSITPAAITIAAPSLSKTYDGNAYTDSDDAATVTGKPTNGTTPTYSLTDISGDKNAGTYPITVTANKTDNPDYTVTVTAGSLVIKPQSLTPATPNTPTNPADPNNPDNNKPGTNTAQAKTSLTIIGTTKVYDGTATTDPTTFTVEGPSDYSGFTIPTTLTANDFDTTGIISQNVGSYTVKLSAAGLRKLRAANLNFMVDDDDIQDGLFVITKRPVTVTADAQTKAAGKDDPTLTATMGAVVGKPESGLVKGDTLNYTLSRAKGETPGDYAISITDGTNPNYTLTDTAGKLSITPVVTLHIEDQDGKAIAGEPDTILTSTDKVGTVTTVTQTAIDGYKIEAGQPTSYTITGDSTQTVTLKYRKNASVLANYFLVDTDKSVAKSKTTNSGVGLTYTTTALDLKAAGYTLVSTPTNASGTLGDTNKPVNYYYTVDYTPVPTTSDGQPPKGYTPSVKPQKGTGTPGQPINSKTTVPKIPGYTVTTVPNVPDKPGQVKVIYTPETETVTVHYYVVNSSTSVDGSSMITLTGGFGDSYQTQAKSFAGYRLVATPTNADGTYGVVNKDVDYYYGIDYTVVPITPAGATIPNIVTPTGTGTPGDPINPDGGLPQIPGYTPVVTPIKVPGQPGQVKVTYVPGAETVLVEYVDQNGKQLREPIRLQGRFGTQYQTEQMSFVGYHLIKVTGQQSGHFAQVKTIVIYQYGSAGKTSQPGNLPSIASQAPSVAPSAGSQVPSLTPSNGSQTPSAVPSGRSETPSIASQAPSNSEQPKGSASGAVPRPRSATPKSGGPESIGPVGKTSQSGSLQSDEKLLVSSQAQSLAGAVGERPRVAKLSTGVKPSHAQQKLPSQARLPQTGEKQVNAWIMAGLSLLTSCLIFVGVRKNRRRKF